VIRSVLRVAFSDIHSIWINRKDLQVPLFILGVVLIGSGLFHVVVWLLQGGSLEGPVSWRKPITFGVSGGITTLTLGWVLGYIPRRAGLKLSAWIYTVAMFLEVALITMQKWRGVGSHFNFDGPFNAAVFRSMGFLIVVVSLVIGWWAWLSIRRLLTPPDMGFAIRAGLILLSIGNVLGLFLAVYGSMQLAVSPGHAPNIFGQAGMMKVPHAVALHGIQILPFLSWLLLQVCPDRESV
jgi:hypothetical protein